VIIHNPFPLALGLICVKTFYTIRADAHSDFSDNRSIFSDSHSYKVKVKPKIYQKLRVYDDYEKIGIISSAYKRID